MLMKSLFVKTLLLALSFLAFSTANTASAQTRVIFDTDYSTDVDDVAALAVLHALADNGEATIVAIGSSTELPKAPGAIDAINTYYRRPNIPLGTTKDGPGVSSRFLDVLFDNFPHNTPLANDVEDVVRTYRRELLKQPDRSVVFMTVGYATNLEALMKSAPDDISPLTGMAIVRRKVKEWACMGGNFWTDSTNNVNFTRDPQAIYYSVNNFPNKITFIPREVASNPSPIRIGKRLVDTPANNPVLVAYRTYHRSQTNLDHHVADIATVLYAVRGARNYWDIEDHGSMAIQTNGRFTWNTSVDRDHNYLVMKGGYGVYSNADEIEKILSDLLIKAPGVRSGGGATPSPTPSPTPAPTPGPTPMPTTRTPGLVVSYYNDPNLGTKISEAVVSVVNQNFGTGSPRSGISSDRFSLRYEGFLQAPHTSGDVEYEMHISVNDGARLYLNGVLLINLWQAGPLKSGSARVTLKPNSMNTLRIDYFENTHGAEIRFEYQSPSISRSVVPASQLFH